MKALATAFASLFALGLVHAGQAAASGDGHGDAIRRATSCRPLIDRDARLACYDTAIAALEQAEAGGELVVLDADRVEEVRREAFGFSLPALDGLQRRAPSVDRVSLTVERTWRAPDGDWMLAMTDGQVWRQVDGRVPRAPKAGSTAEIRRAALGSYLMKLDGQTAVRARREE